MSALKIMKKCKIGVNINRKTVFKIVLSVSDQKKTNVVNADLVTNFLIKINVFSVNKVVNIVIKIVSVNFV